VEPHQPLGDAGPPAGDPDPEALRTSVTAELRALRREVAESAAAQRAMWQQVAAGLEAADPGLLALRVDLADALEAVRDRVVATLTDTGDTTQAALTDTTTGVAKVADRLRESLLDRLEEQHSAVRARLAEVAAQSLASTAATRNTSERLATLTTATEQVRRTVQALQGDWNARVDEAAARAGRVAEDSVTELRDRLEVAVSALTTAATGMADAHRRLDEAAAQLQLQSAELLLARSAEPQSFSWAEPDLAQRLAEYEEPEPEADLQSLPDPESEPEPQRASEPEPEREDLELESEREELDPDEQEKGSAAPYAEASEEAPEPAPIDTPRLPRRSVPHWRRY
jgi:hypothetical protein